MDELKSDFPESNLTLRDYLRVLFRQKAVVITTIITVIATVLIGLQFKTPQYEAQVKMLISAEKLVDSIYYKDLAAGYRSAELTLTQAEIVTSNPVLERAVKAVGLYERPLDYETTFSSWLKRPFIKMQAKEYGVKLAVLPESAKRAFLYRLAMEDLRQHVKVEPVRDTNIFAISVRDYSPYGAAILANVISRSYIIFDLEQQLAELALKYGEKHTTYIQMKDNIDKMAKNLTGETLPNIEAIGPATVKVVEQAQLPLKSVGPSSVLILLLAVFMSLFLAVMLAFTFEYLDQTFKSPQDIETYLGVPFLGSIPQNMDVFLHLALADQVYLLMKNKGIKSVLVVSALAGEGVTSTVASLGKYLSKAAHRKVLIIDANLRLPGIPAKFDLVGAHGLADILEGRGTLGSLVKDMGNNLSVLTAGKTTMNPLTLLDSPTMQEIIRQARDSYDIVLIDGPELNLYKDSVVLSRYSEGVMLVIDEGKTRKQVVKAAVEPVAAKVIGAVLNNRTFVIPKVIYDRI